MELTRPPPDPSVRLLKILKAPPEQLLLIDRVLAGERPFPHHRAMDGPLLIKMGDAAQYLGVSRATLWRMVCDGHLPKVEFLPGKFRVRRHDVERIAAGDGRLVRMRKQPRRQGG